MQGLVLGKTVHLMRPVPALLLLSSCSSWTYLGNQRYAIECRGAGSCYEEAAYVCPFGYDVLGSWSGTRAAAVATPAAVTVVQVRDRELVIQCWPALLCKRHSDCPRSYSMCGYVDELDGRAACIP